MRTPRVWLYAGMCALLAAAATAFYRFGVLPQRREAEDHSVRLWEIRAAAAQFFTENPARVFASYEDLIGPHAIIEAARPVNGEDYHQLFPLRIDFDVLSVTMGDGRQVIVMPDGALLQRAPNGRLRGAAAEIERYQASLEKASGAEGMRTVTLPSGARLETAYRGGQPDGLFRAYYPDGKLWAEAVYSHGHPSGQHTIYDRDGKVIYGTVFVP